MDNTQVVDHEEFDHLNIIEDWLKGEWGNELDPIPDEVVEIEEDFELKDISQLKELSREEV